MTDFHDDLAARIEKLDTDGAARDWMVETGDGRVVVRASSREGATDIRAMVVRLSRGEILDLKITSRSVTADYFTRTGLESAESRFCDWAIRQYGIVSISTSTDSPETRFAVANSDGIRAEGRTLALALFSLMQCCAVEWPPSCSTGD